MAKPLSFDASLDLIEEGPVVERVMIRRRPEDGGHVGNATKMELADLSHGRVVVEFALVGRRNGETLRALEGG